ncbi:MFS transporter [Arenibacter sp. GZD96]|uniref:MFS transporter n=1 Tax=Aurantibrevibacter litoralis TaxID=3106030 RepID=UPI002AFFA5FC|nr:MFS transporter [Arenibacter sp. GZD-96]MEA1786121.1 MFS transporter [Arenibacter sp. GZD-96]
MNIKPRGHILPIIILSQFACTSLWFAGNAIVGQLALATGIGTAIVGYLLSSVQFGFILGTLVFALLMVVDRFPPARVFMGCAFLAALCNAALLIEPMHIWIMLFARFGTGFFMAGIYPVGMKIAADYYDKGLGKALGFLVGALVLGSAFPYLVTELSLHNHTHVIKTTSVIALLGGLALWVWVPNGPYRKPSFKLQVKAGPSLFNIKAYKKATFGYFGHMWELYAFWAFTPLAIQTYNTANNTSLSVPLWTSVIIGIGSFSCILGGMLSKKVGSRKVAWVSLLLSGIFCLLSPWSFQLPAILFLGVWSFWGMAVISDSPQFSTLAAAAIPPALKGTGLTLMNSIGFAISIISIQTLSFLADTIDTKFLFLILFLGPFFGIWSMNKKMY